MTVANPSNYWISSNALRITLNANGDADYIQGNTASGAMILCYIKNVDGLGYDAGHNYQRWKLLLSPTFFPTKTAKYVYVAIPRADKKVQQDYAQVVFPSELLDIYGKNASEQQIGSTDYYYIWLQGIISASEVGGVLQDRVWTEYVQTGTLASDEAYDAGGDNTWWRYSSVDDIVTFLKGIVMDAHSWFENIRLGRDKKNIVGVANDTTEETNDDRLVTPKQVIRLTKAHYLNSDEEDIAQEQIGFLKGLWIKTKGLFGFDEDGNAKVNDFNAAGDADILGDLGVNGDATIDGILKALEQILTNRIQSDNFNGDGPFDTGFELIKNDGTGYSYAVVDKLYVRLKAIFNELEIRKISYSGGNIIFSHAGSRIVAVKELQLGVEGSVEGSVLTLRGAVDVADNVLNVGSGSVSGKTLSFSSDRRVYAYRCYIMKDDGTTATENWWRIDDQARCQTFNVVEPGNYQNAENTSYWRRVIAVGQEEVSLRDSEEKQMYDYVDLSLVDCMQGSDIPKAGDSIVQMGNRTDTERQGFISLEVSGEYAPALKVYKGVSGYTLENKRKICISPKLTDIRAQKFIIETEYETTRVPTQRKDPWYEGMQCYYYDLVQHNGSSWYCIYPEEGIGGVMYTTEEPSDTATYWRVYAQKGKDGKDGKSFNILGSYDTEAELIAAHPTGSVGDAYIVAGDLYVWDDVNTRWKNSGRIQGETGRGIKSATISYGVSSAADTLPTDWEDSVSALTIGPGDYLFVRTILIYTDDQPSAASYSISRFGLDGSYKQTAFCRTNKNIASQQLSGNPLPNNIVVDGETIVFSDGVPQGETIVWATSNIFYGDGTQEGWSAPAAMTDTSTFDVEFSPSETKPANPSEDESQRTAQGWYDPTRNPTFDFTTAIWRAERQKKNGVWGPWAIEKIKGEKGDKGDAGADSVTTFLSQAVVEIPTDTDGKALEDTVVELSAKLFILDKEISVTDITVTEQSSQNVASVVRTELGMMPWATSDDASVSGKVLTIGRNGSVSGSVLTISGDAFNVTPSRIVVRVAAGTVVDEHLASVRVTGVDADKNTHYGFAAFNIQRQYVPKDGEDGVDGKDAINIIVTPASLIVNQSLQDPDNLRTLSEEIIFSGTSGESQVAVSKVEITNTEHCTVSGSNSNYATLTAIEADSNGHYYDQASFICKVTTEYGVIEGIKVRVYANLLGTWKETVEADTKTAIAQSTLYEFTGDSEVSHTEKLGEFIASSKKYETKLTSKVIDENGNIVKTSGSLYEQTSELISLSVESKENTNLVPDPDIYQPTNVTPSISRSVSLIQGRTYTLSAELRNQNSTSSTCAVTIATLSPMSCSLSANQTKVFSQSFTAPASGTFTLSVGQVAGVNVNWLQLEQGEAFTQHNSISSAFKRTGIDIENGLIKATTDNFIICNSNGTQTFSVDSDGNLVSSGSAKFSGTIEAKGGTIGGFVIGTHLIKSSNEKIVLNDDGTATIGNMSVASDGKITATGVDISGKITASDGTISGDIQVTGSLYAGPLNGRHVRIMPDGTANGGIKLYNGSNVLASFSFGQESEGSIPVWLPMIKVFKPNDNSFSRITADGLLASVDSNYSTRASYGSRGFNIMSSDVLVDFGIYNGKLSLSAYNHASLQHAWETNPDNISYGGVYLAYIGGRSVLCVKT